MTTANPHLRAIAIAGALAAAAVLLGGYTLSHRSPGTSSAPEPALTVAHHPATPTAAAAAKAKSAHAARPAAPAVKAKTATTATTVPKAKPAPAPVVQAALAYGLPKAVAQQFATHSVVVVALYSPDSRVDQLTAAEAQSGAALGGAGFVAVESTKEGATGALTKLLGVLDVPALLVFQRPDAASVQQYAAAKAAAPKPRYAAAAPTVTPPEFKLFVTLSGFNDRETVAQAARNADPDPGLPSRQTAWAAGANDLCTTIDKRVAPIGQARTPADLKRLLPTFHSAAAAYLAGLRKLPAAPAAQAKQVARFVSLETQAGGFAEKMLAAGAKKDAAAVATLGIKLNAVSSESDTLAVELGATACTSSF